ncbi:MAG: hypothetical protein HZC55_19355 [Verrucomicrobia bacterium]|nr:hypothetical protein [Verrucomicrobiota bacterium]
MRVRAASAVFTCAGLLGVPGVVASVARELEDLESDSLRVTVRRVEERKLIGLVATYGPYTRHTGKGDYNSHPNFVGLEWEDADRWAYGASYFKNSFSQPCWFAHVGRRFTFGNRDEGFFAKVLGGVIYGYRTPHEKSVPLNFRGFCPAVIPSVGYQSKGKAVHLAVYGKNAGQMLLLSWDLR